MTFQGPSGPTEVFVKKGTCRAEGAAVTIAASHCSEMIKMGAGAFIVGHRKQSMMRFGEEKIYEGNEIGACYKVNTGAGSRENMRAASEVKQWTH